MSDIKKLIKIKNRIEGIKKKIIKAQKLRKRLSKRISGACKTLKNNPKDQIARKILITSLNAERRFLDIIKGGSKEGIRILNNTLKELDTLKVNPDVNAGIKEIITNLKDSMRFVKQKGKSCPKKS